MIFFDGDITLAILGTAAGYYYYYTNNQKKKSQSRGRVPDSNKSALLIGCDYENTNNELRGCSKDITEMNQFLSKKGYPAILLCDDDDRNLQNIKAKPIGKNIVAEMLAMAEKPKKHMFLHYSGHGSYVNDTSGDEDDGRDEVIVATDNVLIKDDDINAGFLARLPMSTRCFVLMDCCHSSTALDLRYRYEPKGDVIENSKDSTKAEIICISGCMDTQTSADAYIEGSFRGAMTTAFLQAYEQNKGKVTLKQHLEHMRFILMKSGYTQIPQLTYNNEKLGDKTLNYFLGCELPQKTSTPGSTLNCC